MQVYHKLVFSYLATNLVNHQQDEEVSSMDLTQPPVM